MESILLYNYTGQHNVINKKLETGVLVQGYFYDTMNIQTPTVDIDSTVNMLNANYAYIPTFNRYYFIEQVSVIDSERYRVILKEDVLKTWENTIAEILGTVTKSAQADKYNSNYSTVHNVQPTTAKTDFENNFSEDGEIIMVTLRGV